MNYHTTSPFRPLIFSSSTPDPYSPEWADCMLVYAPDGLKGYVTVLMRRFLADNFDYPNRRFVASIDPAWVVYYPDPRDIMFCLVWSVRCNFLTYEEFYLLYAALAARQDYAEIAPLDEDTYWCLRLQHSFSQSL